MVGRNRGCAEVFARQPAAPPGREAQCSHASQPPHREGRLCHPGIYEGLSAVSEMLMMDWVAVLTEGDGVRTYSWTTSHYVLHCDEIHVKEHPPSEPRGSVWISSLMPSTVLCNHHPHPSPEHCITTEGIPILINQLTFGIFFAVNMIYLQNTASNSELCIKTLLHSWWFWIWELHGVSFNIVLRIRSLLKDISDLCFLQIDVTGRRWSITDKKA